MPFRKPSAAAYVTFMSDRYPRKKLNNDIKSWGCDISCWHTNQLNSGLATCQMHIPGVRQGVRSRSPQACGVIGKRPCESVMSITNDDTREGILAIASKERESRKCWESYW